MYLEGYAYQQHSVSNRRAYWVCKKSYRRECSARAVTSDPKDGEPVVVYKGPSQSGHTHPPNVDENTANQLRASLKRKAADHPEQPPSQLLRNELQGLEDEVLSQLPTQPALIRSLQRVRRKELPSNPLSLSQLGEIPARYQQTLVGEHFLLHDSGPPPEESSSDSDSESDDGEPERARQERPRVIVFATRKNLELLCESAVWFLDGTFKTAPSIFAQVFTIMGSRKRAGHEEEVAVPLVYALLTGKKTELYKEVLEVVKDAVARFNVPRCNPMKVMTDFELAIINAVSEVFPNVPVSGCYFHLGQILYRRIQGDGLQAQYRDPADRSVKRFAHMLLALAFVPVADVRGAYKELRRACPQILHGVYDEFNAYYISGRRATGRRAATQPRYPPALWNQYNTAINKSCRTNNNSEGWHNRFQLVVSKHHPDLYTFIKEIQKEQGFTEICVTELAMGKRVKAAPTKKWADLQGRLESIASEYNTRPILEYLRAIAANVEISGGVDNTPANQPAGSSQTC